MAAIQSTPGNQARLRTGAALMTLAGLAFVAYAVVFLGLNFSGAFLELGIGPDQVDKGMAEVEANSGPSPQPLLSRPSDSQWPSLHITRGVWPRLGTSARSTLLS